MSPQKSTHILETLERSSCNSNSKYTPSGYRSSSARQDYLNCSPNNSDKENDGEHNFLNSSESSRRIRNSISTNIFEEEPVFSDSEDEREYSRKLLEDHNLLPQSRSTKVHVGVQCNLIHEPQGTHPESFIDFIKKCAMLNPENFSEDFRELITICRRLEHKHQYDTPPHSLNQKNDGRNSMMEWESNMQMENIGRQDLSSSVPLKFYPSKQGSDDFLSESYSFEKNHLNVTALLNTLMDKSNSEMKVPKIHYVRRSTRKIKPVKSCDFVTTDKNRRNKLKVRKDKKGKENKDDVLQFILNRNGKNRRKSGELIKNKEYIFDRIILAKRRIRSLARNWMKPNKTKRKQSVLDDQKPLRQTQRSRQLYSPSEWLTSKNFAHLCES